jgi:hypothetical protein
MRLGIVAVILFFAGAPSVATATSSGVSHPPTAPHTPNSGWVALDKGEQHWYTFYNAGGAVEDGGVTIRMTVLPADGATFVVLTEEQVRRWLLGEQLSAVGAGTKM